MNDDNGNIIDFATRFKKGGPGDGSSGTVPEIVIEPGKFEFHLYTPGEGNAVSEPIISEGYIKFGPAFIAVVDGPADTANIVFAVQTGMVKYVRRLLEIEVELEEVTSVSPVKTKKQKA